MKVFWRALVSGLLTEVFSATSGEHFVLEKGEDEGGAGDLADFAGAGGDVLQGVPALFEQGITRGQLSLHADRGSSMTSKPVALLLADLGVIQSHSRPHVSNDNPYSEAQFKTLKYRPGFPARFASIEAARAHCQEFFPWYNNEHRHGGLGLHTAADVHHGHAPAVRAARAQVLDAAYLAHPERFVSKPPAPPELPGTSWINPPQEKEASTQ